MAGQIVQIVLIVNLLALILAPNLICALKGKLWFALFFGGTLAVVGAIRLAKPGSWWARRFYDCEKTMRAVARFANDPLRDTTSEEVAEIWEYEGVPLQDLDRITRRALRKAGVLDRHGKPA